MVTGSHISENVRTRIGIAHICWNLAYSVAMTSLEAAVNEWVDYLRVEKGASAHTVSNYRRDALRYARDLGERGVVSLADVNARDIEDYTMRLASGEVTGSPAAASSVARASAAIRGLHKYALTEGLVGVDPAAQLRAPRQGRHLPKALTVDEVGRLLDVAHADDSPIGLRDCALLELLYATGARVSEAVSLSADDLDLDGDVPVVRLFGKGRKERIVPVGSFAVEAVEAYRVRARPALAARGRGATAFFLNSRGGPLSRQSAWTAIRRAAEAAQLGERISPHTMRHSFATHLLEGGASVREVQELLGHSSVATTQIYTAVTAAALREVFTLSHPRARGTNEIPDQ